MLSVNEILRSRRKRSQRIRRIPGSGLIFRAVLGIISMFLLLGILALASVIVQMTADLPPVESLETHFGAVGRESYVPVRFYDREGETVLYEAVNPHARDNRWLYIKENGLIDIQEHTLRAVLAALEPDYLSHPAPTIPVMVRDLLTNWMQGSNPNQSGAISRALVEAQLIPLDPDDLPSTIDQLRVNLLAQELSREYSKFQVLEWFLNSADFGHDAYGIDAAALVYLDKHASELSLAESALLASIPLQPSINPFTAFEENQERQARVLETMLDRGWISPSQARSAERESLVIARDHDTAPLPIQTVLGRWLEDRLGAHALDRSGLVVFTTIDPDIQQQAECVLATQLERLAGGVGNETVATTSGTPCLAAGLIPPLRPRDQGVDHALDQGAFVVLDPQTGEILALAGAVDVALGADEILSPLIYLTAFSQGYAPGSMILDLPIIDALDSSIDPKSALEQAHGPVRIRTALANLYPYAVGQMEQIVGAESVERISRSLGLDLASPDIDAQGDSDKRHATLLELASAYGVLAFQGQNVGAPQRGLGPGTNGSILQPEILLEVEDHERIRIYRYQPETSAVVSPQLAYLLNDILRDESARWQLYGVGNVLEVGKPTAAIAGMSLDKNVVWTIGYTPSIVVGVWMGNLTGAAPVGITPSNSAAATWQAITQYVTREMPPQDWAVPPGVSTIDVCDPSGLLPTIYCPEVVSEVFSSGTEPITFDNLYQPYQINLETGKLATLFTPSDQIAERIYLVPPPEAQDWAEVVGLEQPPTEYDTLSGEVDLVPGVAISTPGAFEFVRGELRIRGEATIDDFAYYRLQYGEGLNPTQWVQIGEQVSTHVTSGILASWDTSSLDGLYTLQLIVVDQEGQLFTSVVNLTIDNQPPIVEVVLPVEGQSIEASDETGIVLQVQTEDNYGIASVEFYIDDRLLTTLTSEPFSTRWEEYSGGEHEFFAVAEDIAGNKTTVPSVIFTVPE